MDAALNPSDAGLGVLLRQYRQTAGLTQEELAERSGMTPRAIANIERGRTARPYRRTVHALADALELTRQQRELLDRTARPGSRHASADPPDFAGPTGPVPRQLPAAVSHFAGRATELDALSGLVDRAGERDGTVVISAIAGTAGVGKSGLALHWAHQVAHRYPDGQLYVNMRGYDASPPLSAADVLAAFLRALGMPGKEIPDAIEERAACYRSLLATRRMLIVLDNARDASHVRPLLPGAASCATLVTSRDSLAGLVARDGAWRIELDLLPIQDAVGLLQALIGDRVAADPGAAAMLAESCCRLPLALRVAAELAAARPAVTLAHLAVELGDQQQRLDLLDAAGDPATAVRAVLSWSYRHLDQDIARAFRLLGLHQGPDFDVYAAAALFGTTVTDTARLLDRLARTHLIQPAAPGRYGMHDLLRRYATDLAVQTMTRGERQVATARLLDYLQSTAASAESVQQIRSSAVARYRVSDYPGPDFADRDQAMAWLRAERAVLLACLDNLIADGKHARVLAVTAGLASLLRTDGPWPQARVAHAAAVHAARELGDRLGEADALLCLGEALDLVSDPAFAETLARAGDIFRDLGDQLGLANVLRVLGSGQLMASDSRASDTLAEALRIFRDLGDRPGLAGTLTHLAEVRRLSGHYANAVTLSTEALDLFSALGDRAGYAGALVILGLAQGEAESCPAAVRSLSEALGIYCELGSRHGQANALGNLAQLKCAAGDYEAAAVHLNDALKTFRDLGNKPGEAYVLRSIGDMLCETGDYQGAATCLSEALAIFTDLGHLLGRAHVLRVLGELWISTEDLPAAEEALAEALAIYRDHATPYASGAAAFEPEVLNKAGTLHLRRGDLAGAAECYQQALDLARRLGMPRREGRALAGLARCARLRRDDATAVTFFRQAHAVLLRFGVAEAHAVASELESLRVARGR